MAATRKTRIVGQRQPDIGAKKAMGLATHRRVPSRHWHEARQVVEKVLSCTFSTRRVRYTSELGFDGSIAYSD
ncbi:MAG: hypothetical protein EPN38_11185 [Rhodanobacteraceae bacterium]|nr:MAG: hypothetical protein EPN38_11185 [Rhodanobacteraceae bacterium]